MRHRWLVALLLLMVLAPGGFSAAQGDGLNLPTELYILRNAGTVERYGLGAVGVVAVTPEDDFVVDFAVAPDGAWLAYRTDSALFLADMADPEREPIQIEGATANFPPLRQGGQTMAFSPDGGVLIFTTEYGARAVFDQTAFVDVPNSPLLNLSWSPEGGFLAAEAENDVWWVYRRDPAAMTLIAAIPASAGTTWAGEGQLIFAPPEGGLTVMDLQNANAQTVIQPAANQYRLPVVRDDGDIGVFTLTDDGETYAFQRMAFDGQTAVVEQTSEVGFVLDGGLDSVAWAPQGQFLVALRQGAMALVLPEAAQEFPLPVADAVAFGWGAPRPAGSSALAIDEALYLRSPDAFGVQQVWQVPADGSDRLPLTSTEFDVTAYALSPDEATLAYVSGASLWRLDLGTLEAEPVELAKVNETATDLAFNPDGSAVFYTTTNQLSGGIWTAPATVELDAAGEAVLNAPEQLLTNTDAVAYGAPQHAPNLGALLVMEMRGAGDQAALYDLAAGTLVPLGAADRATWLPDGRVLAVVDGAGDGAASLRVYDPAADPVSIAGVIQLSGEILDARPLSADRVRLLLQTPGVVGPNPVLVQDVPLVGGEPAVIADAGYLFSPALSGDGEQVAAVTLPGRVVIVFTLAEGSVQVLNSPVPAVDLRWSFSFK